MTTILDPGGTPVVSYNKSGTTIDTLISAGKTQSTAAPIVRFSGWTVVIAVPVKVDEFGNASSVRLPDDAEIGDLVEVHFKTGAIDAPGGVLIFPESGAQINEVGVDTPIDIGISTSSTLLRKIGATQWRTVSKT